MHSLPFSLLSVPGSWPLGFSALWFPLGLAAERLVGGWWAAVRAVSVFPWIAVLAALAPSVTAGPLCHLRPRNVEGFLLLLVPGSFVFLVVDALTLSTSSLNSSQLNPLACQQFPAEASFT